MNHDEAGLLELIENIVFPWSYQNELPEEESIVFPCTQGLFDRNLD